MLTPMWQWYRGYFLAANGDDIVSSSMASVLVLAVLGFGVDAAITVTPIKRK